MSERTLYDKVWDSHTVAKLPTGQDQVFIGLHLVHEVTTPQAFDILKERGLRVAFPERTVATVDHIIPTLVQIRPFEDAQAEEMFAALEKNVDENGIRFLHLGTGRQGIVHVIGPELGLSQPGMTIACGDSHTSTHGAVGSLGFGIGTTEVAHVLATQTLALSRLKVRRINVTGELRPGVFPKDVILRIIHDLGINGGLGHAYEYGGAVFDKMTMEGRMTVCNMSIEGGARIGYVNPDEATLAYLKGRDFAPQGEAFDKAAAYWKSVASEKDAAYDHVFDIEGESIEPMVTWGINPGHSVGISEKLPRLSDFEGEDRRTAEQAYAFMGLKAGDAIQGTKIDVAFLGSCTNSRLTDLREGARILKGRKVNPKVKMLVVPGSQKVKEQAEAEGLHAIFMEAGAEWRGAGCSMCLGMNPDKLVGSERSISSSNRNFIGRQGSPKGRTHLGSPAMVAASAIEGCLTDPREF
ncbi:MAG: 3-isopropylmalate dehydratase large subunit [Candidatus Tectomicrobia bacterium]|uniref:3-isopropylmalate dehydratase large subunit n=1 Tax=Tectimicrobiota bacterium TaxID=2528274 RepID=A0A932HVR5_UNCTE|nr:3-isopropylmalate dehydratase large subunit [Candidatus Tectomicrobia bacterium]